MKSIETKKKRGQILVLSLVILAVGAIYSVSLIQFATFDLSQANQFKRHKQAQFLGEAGIERAVYELSQDGNYTGNTYTDLSTGTYAVTVTDSGGDKIVDSQGKLSDSGGKTRSQNKRRAKLVTQAGQGGSTQQIAVNEAVSTDDEGITLGNSSQIKGDAVTNGNIACSGTPAITGDATAQGSITSSPACVQGNSNPFSGPQNFPSFDYDFWKTKANQNNDPIPGFNLSGTETATYGPKKIEGNVTTTNSSIIKLTGPIHITGDLTLNGDSRIQLDQTLIDQALGTVVVVDGSVSVNNSARVEGSGNAFLIIAVTKVGGTGLQFNGDANTYGSNKPIVFANFSTAKVNNSTKGLAIIANGLEGNGSAVIEFQAAAANATYSTGTISAPATFTFSKGTYQEIK